MNDKVSSGFSASVLWRWAVLLSLLSGAAALGHQLLWTRRMIDLLGAGAESSSRVFGVFFLGLAVGSAAAFLLVPRIRSPWRWLAGAETAIFLLALPIYFLPAWSAVIWPALGPDRLVDGTGGLVKLLVSILLLLPPAFLMGWFLPILAAAVLGGERNLQRHGVRLYGWNTLGGVLGLGLTAAILLPALGAPGAFAAVLGLNALTAAGCVYIDRKTPRCDPEPAARGVRDVRVFPSASAGAAVLILAFLSGFGVLALEVAFLEMIMLVAPLSFYAPAGVLFCVIFLLAGAAFAAGPLQRRFSIPVLLAGGLAAASAAAAVAPVVFFGVSYLTGGLPPASGFSLFLLRLAVFSLVVCGPAFFLAGLAFPLLTAWSGRCAGDSDGRRWGRLLAINGMGGLCGAELAYRWLLPEFGLYGTVWSVGLLYAAAAFIAAFLLADHSRESLWGRMAAVCGTVLLMLLLKPVQSLTTVNPFMRIEVIEEWSGREGTLAVVERGDFGRGLLAYNQYMLGTTAAQHDQARQAHLPLLLHPAPARVAFIGLATGITPGAALLHRGVEDLVSIELSSMVADAAAAYFSRFQNGLFEDPRARIVIEDGRTYIAAGPERFDAVIGDLFLPWGPGEARLYSIEHFEAVRASLDSGGVFCQWLALYQLRPEDLEVILRTFQRVFPETHLFVNGFHSESPSLALVGFAGEGRLDWETVDGRAEQERGNGLVKDLLMRHRAGVQLLYLGEAGQAAPGRIHTLNNMLIELEAGRERVTGNPAEKYLSGKRWEAFVADRREGVRESSDGVRPEIFELATLLTERERRIRNNEPLRAIDEYRIAELFPAELLEDSDFESIAWPGTLPRFFEPGNR